MDGASGNKAFVSARCLGARCLVSHVSAAISQRPRRCPDNIICAFVNLLSLQSIYNSTSFVKNLTSADALPLNWMSIVQSCATGSREQGMFDWFLPFLIRRLVACAGPVTTVTRQDHSEGDWVTHSLHWVLYSLHPHLLEIYSRTFAWGQIKLEPVKNYTAM